jgi:hypothetical protein
MAIHTLRAVFPQVSLWAPEGGDLILIGSFAPQLVDADRLRRDLQQPAYLEWMRRAWGVEGAEGLIAHHLVPSPLLDRLADSLPAPVNTDDVNVLEFSFARSVGDERYDALGDIFATLKDNAYRPQVVGAVDWQRVEDDRQRVGWTGYHGPEPSKKAQAVMAGCSSLVGHGPASWPSGLPAEDPVESWVLGYTLAMKGDDAALTEAARLERDGFSAESLLVRERLAETRKEYDSAVSLLLGVFTQLRKTALPLCDVNQRALDRAKDLATALPARGGDLIRAIAQGPFAVYKSERWRQETLVVIAAPLNDPKLCLLALGAQRTHPDWRSGPLRYRARCLKQIGAPDAAAAQADLFDFLQREPEEFRTTDPLAAPAQSAK